MKLAELFKQKRVLSFEVFPPKHAVAVSSIYGTLDSLRQLNPDFISVTYGANGTDNCRATLAIASAIRKDYGIESVAHLPCINLTRENARHMLDRFQAAGIQNILALRGDAPRDSQPDQLNGQGDFRYASDLVTWIKYHGDFNVIGACYPEGHRESDNIAADIRNLKTKVDAGADHLITQLFFDNSHFYRFREHASQAGIGVPIEAGIMPVSNIKQIEGMVKRCGVSLPRRFIAMVNRFEHNPEALLDAGIAYAIDQIADLIALGVDGIHLYTMNNTTIALKICEAVFSSRLNARIKEPAACVG